jgi:hypothetical protein
MAKTSYVLSLRQPWATLLVHGRKMIEIRSWTTVHRGKLLIHAAKLIDPRREAWKHVPRALMKATEQRGGIIGSVELTGVCEYSTKELFTLDRRLHLNEPAWFRAPKMYGLVVTRAKTLPFRAVNGQVKIFSISENGK